MPTKSIIMGIDVQFPNFDKIFDDFISQKEKAILETLDYIGQQCQNDARSNGAYQDHTGNLRASCQYRVIRDGKTYSGSGSEGSEGANAGDELLDKLSFQYSMDGAVLIVVAGMKYAAAVEAKGFNVLTSAELLADQLVPQLLDKLKQ